jgi:hypothetical protein
LDLKGEYGRINGKGYDYVALDSNSCFWAGKNKDTFNPGNVGFNALAFSELCNSLGLEHHEIKTLNPCVMTHNHSPEHKGDSLETIRVCEECYKKL